VTPPKHLEAARQVATQTLSSVELARVRLANQGDRMDREQLAELARGALDLAESAVRGHLTALLLLERLAHVDEVIAASEEARRAGPAN
jgi:hypothetical protein